MEGLEHVITNLKKMVKYIDDREYGPIDPKQVAEKCNRGGPKTNRNIDYVKKVIEESIENRMMAQTEIKDLYVNRTHNYTSITDNNDESMSEDMKISKAIVEADSQMNILHKFERKLEFFDKGKKLV